MSAADSQSPFRSKGFIVAATVVGAIVLAAVVVLVSFLINGGNEADPTPAPSASPTADAGDADPSVCGLEGFEESSSLTSAPNNEWELVGTVAAPTNPEGAGPGTNDDGFRSCYAHTAEGALFAAVNYVALASDTRNVPRLPELVEPGPGRDAALAAGDAGGPSGTRVQVAGFKVNSYTADEAVIDVAWSVTSSGGALVSMPVVLRWVEGDWKIVLTDDGQPPFAASPLDNLGGYTPWAGV